jgi:hypothetical protein
MIGRMRHGPRTLRAPVGHRVVAAVASPLVGYFVARLILELVNLPELPVYAVCLAVAAALGYRAWTARIDLSSDDAMRVHNTLVSQSISPDSVHRVTDSGRIEWRRGRDRPTRSLSETLRPPWWAFGTAATTYARNREELRSWVRTSGRRPGGQPAA